MDTPQTRPLLTLAIASYRHESFIRAAVEGALAQTYSPLEIILSDDCSPDHSFEIMQETVANYSGPHRVVLNRNPRNLGLARHVNHLFAIAKGELFLASAGDDISMPDRAESIWRIWESTGRQAVALDAQTVRIDASGTVIKPAPIAERPFDFLPDGPDLVPAYLHNFRNLLFGATAAWSRRVFDTFGPIPENVVYEDLVLSFRAMLLGGIIHIHDPHVLYRSHENNLVNYSRKRAVCIQQFKEEEARLCLRLQRELTAAQAFRSDLDRALELGLISRSTHATILPGIDRLERARALELRMLNSNWPKSVPVYFQWRNLTAIRYTRFARAALPRSLYYWLRQFKQTARLFAARSSPPQNPAST